MTIRYFATAFVIMAALLLNSSCGQRPTEKTAEEKQREHELKLFADSIRTVQERYVDENSVQFDQIMSNSLKGMVESVDPYATIRFSGNPPPDMIPPDVPLVELVDSEWKEIMVLKVYSFQPMTKKQLRLLENKAREKNPAGILIDCRGAGGDDYTVAQDICDLFLPRGTTIGTILDKQGSEIRPLVTRHHPMWATNTVVVLIDSQTRGPAELLAAALKHYRRATLAGETSRGVAVIQSPIPITDTWTVMLSTGRVRDPDGKDITGNPLKPDLAATPDPDDKENTDYIYRRGMANLRDRLITLE